MNHSHVELKVDVAVPDVRVEVDFDDVRLYLSPARHPVTVVVDSPLNRTRTRPEYAIDKLKVRLIEKDSKQVLGEGVTDEGGPGGGDVEIRCHLSGRGQDRDLQRRSGAGDRADSPEGNPRTLPVGCLGHPSAFKTKGWVIPRNRNGVDGGTKFRGRPVWGRSTPSGYRETVMSWIAAQNFEGTCRDAGAGNHQPGQRRSSGCRVAASRVPVAHSVTHVNI